MAVLRSKAPLRISFCGGGTDLPEYFRKHDGVVLSSTINLYSYATLRTTEVPALGVNSLDYNLNVSYKPEELVINGELDLIKAAAKMMDVTEGVELFLHSDAPPGCGLGSSSTMTVALLALLRRFKGTEKTKFNLAYDAIHLERNILGVPGGWQDQFAATHGGFKLYHFNTNGLVDITELDSQMSKRTVEELQYHCMLVFTGKTRLGKNIIADQVKNYNSMPTRDAMEEMVQLTYDMSTQLIKGDIQYFGHLLDNAWRLKKAMSNKISDDKIDALYRIAMHNGAWGGKLLGAGGGGYLLICAPFDMKHRIANALEVHGAQVIKFEFEDKGVQVWEVPEDGSRAT